MLSPAQRRRQLAQSCCQVGRVFLASGSHARCRAARGSSSQSRGGRATAEPRHGRRQPSRLRVQPVVAAAAEGRPAKERGRRAACSRTGSSRRRSAKAATSSTGGSAGDRLDQAAQLLHLVPDLCLENGLRLSPDRPPTPGAGGSRTRWDRDRLGCCSFLLRGPLLRFGPRGDKPAK